MEDLDLAAQEAAEDTSDDIAGMLDVFLRMIRTSKEQSILVFISWVRWFPCPNMLTVVFDQILKKLKPASIIEIGNSICNLVYFGCNIGCRVGSFLRKSDYSVVIWRKYLFPLIEIKFWNSCQLFP